MAAVCPMPIVILNLGGEMMYVLHQRLKAQKIDPVKAEQVLNEVTGALFSSGFIDELFKPSPLYSFEATKNVFVRISHCSIMKLNEVSMGKLYDLMTMVFKYQVISVRNSNEILRVTQKHIAGMRAYVSDSKVRDMIDACSNRIDSIFGSLTTGAWVLLRQTLLDFVHGRNVKVSLLLQENMQGNDGKMSISLDGSCPRETPVPGKVRHFDAEASINSEYHVDLKVHSVANLEEHSENGFEKAHELLGVNLYALFRSEGKTAPATNESKEPEPVARRIILSSEEKSQAAREDLNVLASLIKPYKSHGKLNIFASSCDDWDDSRQEMGSSKVSDEYGDSDDDGFAQPMLEIVEIGDARSDKRTLQQRMDDLDLDVEDGAQKVADIDDDQVDLLDLMDQACVGDDDSYGRGGHRRVYK